MQNQATTIPWCRAATASALLTGLAILGAGGSARAQGLTVLPVNIEMGPGQLATTLTVINHGNSEISVQIRAMAWNQLNGAEQLTPSDEVTASPPIATIPAGGTQVVRLVLRHSSQGREASYRILLDQIPPPASPGTVRLALRLSIPVFAEPETRALPHLQFHVENDAGQAYLVALNDGSRHETIRDVALSRIAGDGLRTGASTSPYILAGATTRWRITALAGQPAQGEMLHLTGHSDTGAIDQRVSVVAGH